LGRLEEQASVAGATILTFAQGLGLRLLELSAHIDRCRSMSANFIGGNFSALLKVNADLWASAHYEKLNVHPPVVLWWISVFSTVQRHRPSDSTPAGATTDWREHPSPRMRRRKIGETPTLTPKCCFWTLASDASAIAWLNVCPSVNCPTPAGELQRWAICSICAARQR